MANLQTATIQLHAARCENISAAQALHIYATSLGTSAAGSIYGLLYSPTCCKLCLINTQGEPTDEFGHVVSLLNVFEFRAFCEQAEIRWLHDADGVGQAVILSEEPAAFPQESAWTSAEIAPGRRLEKNDLHYLLWGSGSRLNPNEQNEWAPEWSKLYTGQIGYLEVPVPELMERSHTAVLTAREYLGEVDEDGNMAVVEERLTGLKEEGKS